MDTKEENTWGKRVDEYFYNSRHSLTEQQIAHIKSALIEPILIAERVDGQLNMSFDVAKVIKQGKQEALAQVMEVIGTGIIKYTRAKHVSKGSYAQTVNGVALDTLQDLLIEIDKLLNEI